MAAVPNIRPNDIFLREEWAGLTKQNPIIAPLLILHCWSLIIGAAALFIIWPNPLTYIFAIMIIGTRQLGLSILMHDGAHGLLSKDNKLNDFLGGVLTGTPVGADINQYRDYHLQHHKFAQQEEDPDLVLSSPFPVTKESMRRKIIRDLTGQTFFKQRVKPIAANIAERNIPKPVQKFLLANFIIFLLCFAVGFWWAYFTLWIVPLAIWNPLVTRLRNIAEHACVGNADNPWKVARTTIANPVERLFIAPYWVNYHCEHHLFMYVPCYRLRGVHNALIRKKMKNKMKIDRGYLPVLRQAAAA